MSFVISFHHLYLNPLLARFLAVLLIPCGLLCRFWIRRSSFRLRGIFLLHFKRDSTRQDSLSTSFEVEDGLPVYFDQRVVEGIKKF